VQDGAKYDGAKASRVQLPAFRFVVAFENREGLAVGRGESEMKTATVGVGPFNVEGDFVPFRFKHRNVPALIVLVGDGIRETFVVVENVENTYEVLAFRDFDTPGHLNAYRNSGDVVNDVVTLSFLNVQEKTVATVIFGNHDSSGEVGFPCLIILLVTITIITSEGKSGNSVCRLLPVIGITPDSERVREMLIWDEFEGVGGIINHFWKYKSGGTEHVTSCHGDACGFKNFKPGVVGEGITNIV
jgi:hypothetical protein